MNCLNNSTHGEMTQENNRQTCAVCGYQMVSMPKRLVTEVRSKAIQEANRIIGEGLRQASEGDGIAPWAKEWIVTPKQNYVSGRQYKGVNRWILSPYCDYYITAKKITELGGALKEGAHEFTVFIWIPPTTKITKEEYNELTTEEQKKVRRYPIYSERYVYQILDVEGLPEKKVHEKKTNGKIASAEEFIALWISKGLKLIHSGSQPCYVPAQDTVYLPDINTFETSHDYYRTAFHEIAHWTRHKSRLNRYHDQDETTMNQRYGKEELVAEITSAYLARYFDLDVPKNTIAYLHGWAEQIKADAYLITSASAQAEKAIEFLMTQEKSQEKS